MNITMYRSINSIKKESKGTININKGRYMCKIERKDIPQPFAFASGKQTMAEVINNTLSDPIILPKHLHLVEDIYIKNYG